MLSILVICVLISGVEMATIFHKRGLKVSGFNSKIYNLSTFAAQIWEYANFSVRKLIFTLKPRKLALSQNYFRNYVRNWQSKFANQKYISLIILRFINNYN